MAENRFITASRIHDGQGWLPEHTVIEVGTDGTIIGLHDQAGEQAIHYEGVLAPGFVNAHCHLELSHMKGVVPEATGLIPFLQQIPTQRNNFTDEQKKAARHAAFQSMIQNGIVAVGDIANSDETLDLRLRDELHLHTFVECIGFTEQFAQARLNYSLEVLQAFAAQEAGEKIRRQSVIPHAPYSVSAPLFRLINEAIPGSLLSIHNQESLAEDQFYKEKTGPVRDLLSGLGIDDTFFQPSGRSSLQTYLPYLDAMHPLILVHNTFTTEADIRFAQKDGRNISWCLCPNANDYIERQLPDVPLLMRHTENICIGTDSLASNHTLSVLDELQVLRKRFAIDWALLLRWGTFNGARALQMDDTIGSIAPGKRPGIVQLTGLDDTPKSTRIL